MLPNSWGEVCFEIGKELLQVSVLNGLQSFKQSKFEIWKKIYFSANSAGIEDGFGQWYHPRSLKEPNFAAFRPRETYSASIEKSKSIEKYTISLWD